MDCRKTPANMEFRTVIDMPEYPFRIGYGQSGLLLGSCFAASVGERLVRMKMPVTVNPFGTLYNPASVAQGLEILEKGVAADERLLREHDGLWFAFSHSGSFASPDREEALSGLNASVETGCRALAAADYLVLTFGTAWVYALAETGEIVGNCHKLPASAFRRRRLEAEEIVSRLEPLLERPLYRRKQIVLTVSPIRHLKDGLAENQLSKATLLVAAHRLAERFEHVHYFPSYEILLDDLRDYRFYERDMVHPSAVAVDYVWECFCGACVDKEALGLFKSVEKIRAAREHRPFRPDTPRHREFKKAVLAEIAGIRSRYPSLDFTEETTYFAE